MKNIILCFDGTENKFGPAPYSNLLKVFRMLLKDDPSAQICYYQPGIGASMTVEKRSLSGEFESIHNTLDSLIAFSLDEHIIQAYKYLMKFYNEGDKVYFFGFSRGAFTARILCSMIDRVGLLNDGLEELAPGAWSIYSAWEYAAQPTNPDYTTTLADEFKKTFSRPQTPGISFLGLFDCINSVGLLRDRMFPFTSRLSHIKQIRHAVSLDERRGKFKQNLIFPHSYKQPLVPSANSTASKATSFNSRRSSQVNGDSDSSSRLSEARKKMRDIEKRLLAASSLMTPTYPRPESTRSIEVDKQKLLSGEFQEVWFPGNHGDVGGGWSPDINGQFVSNLPLRWMFAEAITAGVIFQKDQLVKFSQRYSSLDSLLSCQHDILSLSSYGLTHKISLSEKNSILELSSQIFQKRSVPHFRSCEIPKTKSLDRLFSSGLHLSSLKRINFDLDNQEVSDIFNFYKEVPSSQVRGLDGRGDGSSFAWAGWWLVELVPLGTKIEDTNCQWRNVYYPNLGRRRVLPDYARLHWSIYWRMKYCFDYGPGNIPDYSKEILHNNVNYAHHGLRADPIFYLNEDDTDSELLRQASDELKENLKLWDAQAWKQVPDDLTQALHEFNNLV